MIIYGKNCNDETIFKKYQQLNDLGICIILTYTQAGCLNGYYLQDIYGR